MFVKRRALENIENIRLDVASLKIQCRRFEEGLTKLNTTLEALLDYLNVEIVQNPQKTEIRKKKPQRLRGK